MRMLEESRIRRTSPKSCGVGWEDWVGVRHGEQDSSGGLCNGGDPAEWLSFRHLEVTRLLARSSREPPLSREGA